jgi:hypothetical protein
VWLSSSGAKTMSFIWHSPPFKKFRFCKKAATLRTPPEKWGSRTAFTNGLVAIEQLLFLVDKARSQGVALKRTLYGFHFLLTEFACAPAGKYAIIIVHKFLLW